MTIKHIHGKFAQSNYVQTIVRAQRSKRVLKWWWGNIESYCAFENKRTSGDQHGPQEQQKDITKINSIFAQTARDSQKFQQRLSLFHFAMPLCNAALQLSSRHCCFGRTHPPFDL